ncbi:MAG TPA: hypothetical protein VGE01_03030 [Fimbriimonas sp.]
MEENRETSLDRFMKTRGLQMLGHSAYKVSSKVQMVIGGFLTAFGVGMIVAPQFGGDPSIVPGSLGPLIAGAVNFAVGLNLHRRFVADREIDVSLTAEAKALLMALHRRLYGWFSPWAWQANQPGAIQINPIWSGTPRPGRFAARRERRTAMWMGVSTDMVPAEIDDAELGPLERVAFEYNRVTGALASGMSASATLAKLCPRIQRAADEAMADALHQAAMLIKLPEGGAVARKRLEAQEASLRELAERMESLVAEQPSLTDKVAYRSSIDDVLDELRLENLARSELHQNDEQRDVQA